MTRLPATLMGIVNLTPDSFSGDGSLDIEAALAQIERLISEGAGIIDIGAESTRPGAQPLTSEEEWRRLGPLIDALPPLPGVAFSLDTHHAATAEKALTWPIGWINDVSGLADPDMAWVLAGSDCRYVLTHALGVPANPSRTLDPSLDPVEEVLRWAEEKLSLLESRGVLRARVVLDPGIGFGKTPQQSAALLRGVERLKAAGCPLLIGHSRKSFLTLATGRPAAERDLETAVVSAFLAVRGVEYLRVHDVVSTGRALAAAALVA